MIASGIILVLFYIVKSVVEIDSWLMLIIVGGGCGVIGYVINYIFVLNRNEKAEVLKMVKKVLKRG